MVTYNAATIPLNRILLDPNNYRFKSTTKAPLVSENRFSEPSVQSRAIEKVKKDGIGELKASIIENGFVPVERIIVRPLKDDKSGQYVAIEGNRRTATLKVLQGEHSGGVDLPQTVIDVFDSVPVLIATDADNDDLLSIMGIRHVGGPKEWGGYQAARLVHELLEDSGLSAREVAARLGLTVQEVNRRNRAFSALAQMSQHEEYSDAVQPEMYPIFHEVMGQPMLRDQWLKWDSATLKFADDENRFLLYEWIAGMD